MNLRREPSIASEKLGGQKIYRHDVEFLHPCEFAAEHVIASAAKQSLPFLLRLLHRPLASSQLRAKVVVF